MAVDKCITLFSFLLNISLKGCLLIAISLVGYFTLKDLSPRLRYAVLLVGLLSLALIPVVSWIINTVYIFITTNHMTGSYNVYASPVLDTIRRGIIEIPRQVDVTTLLKPSRGLVGGVHWSIWFLLIWAGGAVGFLLRILAGKLSIWYVNRASGFRDTGLEHLMCEVKRKLGVTRGVRLVCSHKYTQPAAFSWLRPMVLLPAQARSWTAKQLKPVFTHELSHIKHYDCLVRDIGRIICALFWFIPLIWVAYNRMKNEQEKICDMNVVHFGSQPVDYAEQLLLLAKENSARRFFTYAFIPMVGARVLCSRIEYILQVKRFFNIKNTDKMLPLLYLCAGVLFTLFAAINPFVTKSDIDVLEQLKNTVSLESSMDIQKLPYEIKSDLKAFPVVWPVLEGLGKAEPGKFIDDNQSMRIAVGKWDYGVVVAVADGVIKDINCQFNNIYQIVIEHKHTIYSVYSLVEPCENIKIGDSVCQGDLIGYFVMNKMKSDTYFSSKHYKKYIDFALKTDRTYINPMQAMYTFNKRLYMKY
jgi:beta-lactamase regulating signal transducer with metallopeptidase domain